MRYTYRIELFLLLLFSLQLCHIIHFCLNLSFIAEAAPLIPNSPFLQNMQIPNLNRGIILLKINTK